MKSWRGPFLLIVAAVLVVELSMVALDMGPETLLVAAVVALASSLVWCFRSLSETTTAPPSAPRAFAPPRAVAADRRVKTLRTSILFGQNVSGYTDRLYERLVELIDDQLAHAHDIDRQAEPEAAATIIGPALAAFVNDSAASESLSSTKELTRIVTLIEQI